MNQLEIRLTPDASKEEAFSNIRANQSLNLPMINMLPAHDGIVSICGGGTSLRDTISELKGEIWALNGTHDYLLSIGIKPNVAFFWDAAMEATRHAHNPCSGVKYYVASHCNPKMFQLLNGMDVICFHAEMGHEVKALIEELGWFAPIFHGGSAAATRAPFIAYGLGFREIHLHGADASYSDVTHIDRDDHVDYGTSDVDVTCYGKTFKTTGWMAMQAKEILPMVRTMRDARIVVHGAGLVPHVAANHGLHYNQL